MKAFHPSMDVGFSERIQKFARVKFNQISGKKQKPVKAVDLAPELVHQKVEQTSEDKTDTNPDLNYIFDPKHIDNYDSNINFDNLEF